MAVEHAHTRTRPKRTRRTSLILDLDLMDEARELLGTTTTTDTIHRALHEAIGFERRRSLASRDFPDLTVEALEKMRRPRTFELE